MIDRKANPGALKKNIQDIRRMYIRQERESVNIWAQAFNVCFAAPAQSCVLWVGRNRLAGGTPAPGAVGPL